MHCPGRPPEVRYRGEIGRWAADSRRGVSNGEARSPSLCLVDCLTKSLLLAERFEARLGTDAVVVRRFCSIDKCPFVND